MKKHWAYLLIMLLFSACSTTPKTYKKLPRAHASKPHYTLHRKNFVTQKLMQEYEKWAGVKYCYGGENSQGMDCSALIQTIYKDAFNIQLPRTTKQQIKVGKWVARKSLKEGDILFFATSYHTLHTGIYLERGKFIHASSKYGVILSNIRNPYWWSKYRQARRILR